MSPEVEAPARGVQYALRAFGRPPREARIRAARIRYGRRLADGDESAFPRWRAAHLIIDRMVRR